MQDLRILHSGSMDPGSGDPGSMDPGSWIQDHGSRILDPRIQEPGSRIEDPWIRDPVSRLKVLKPKKSHQVRKYREPCGDQYDEESL